MQFNHFSSEYLSEKKKKEKTVIQKDTCALTFTAALFNGSPGVVASSACVWAQSCLTLCDPVDCSPARPLCPWGSPGKNTAEGCCGLSFPAPGDLPHTGI